MSVLSGGGAEARTHEGVFLCSVAGVVVPLPPLFKPLQRLSAAATEPLRHRVIPSRHLVHHDSSLRVVDFAGFFAAFQKGMLLNRTALSCTLVAALVVECLSAAVGHLDRDGVVYGYHEVLAGADGGGAAESHLRLLSRSPCPRSHTPPILQILRLHPLGTPALIHTVVVGVVLFGTIMSAHAVF